MSDQSDSSISEGSQGSQPNNIEGINDSQPRGQRRKRSVTLMKKHKKTQDLHIKFDKYGGAMGKYYKKFKSWVGVTTRSIISITEPAWNKVDKDEMDLLWHTIKNHWNINDDKNRVPVLKGAHNSWKNFKKRLLAEFFKKDCNPCDVYPYLDQATWKKFCAMKSTKEFLEKSEKGRKNALLNTNPARLGGRPYRSMIPDWEKEMIDPSKWSKIHDLQDERARNFLLARRVKTADGTLILPAHLQQLADEIIEKDRQISQGLWVPGPGVDTLIAVLGPEHGGRTRGVGLKQGIPGILEKKRKRKPLMETDLEEQRMAFNAECEEIRRLLNVECQEKRRLMDVECEAAIMRYHEE